MDARSKQLQVGNITVAIDGTKILANASRHSAVSYERAGEQLRQVELEIDQLLEKAEAADSTPLQDGLTIEAELARRQSRKAALAKAQAERAEKHPEQEGPPHWRLQPRRTNTTSPIPRAGSCPPAARAASNRPTTPRPPSRSRAA